MMSPTAAPSSDHPGILIVFFRSTDRTVSAFGQSQRRPEGAFDNRSRAYSAARDLTLSSTYLPRDTPGSVSSQPGTVDTAEGHAHPIPFHRSARNQLAPRDKFANSGQRILDPFLELTVNAAHGE